MDDLDKIIYRLEFVDLNIIEQLMIEDCFIDMPRLKKRLNKINVWDDGLIRRRLKRLRGFKIIHFKDNSRPWILESYNHNKDNVKLIRDCLRKRLLRYC